MPEEPRVEHVSDTALWVAALRAQEEERPEPLFRDPLAARLAGARGRGLVKSMKASAMTGWVLALRTQAIDRLVLGAVARGVDTIVNLGAGLDTRPYRLALPTTLRWLEIDFPNIIDLKSSALEHEKPSCVLDRIPVDLSRSDDLHAALSGALVASSQTAVLTEGVLQYLEPSTVAALASELRLQAAVRYWILDYHHGGIPGRYAQVIEKDLRAAPFRFQTPDMFGYFRDYGFEVDEKILLAEEAERLRRWPPLSLAMLSSLLFSTPSARKAMRQRSGWALFEKRA